MAVQIGGQHVQGAEMMAEFRTALVERGLKFTRQRQAIADAFFNAQRHLGLNQILELAREKHASVGYATVYRTMKLMDEVGLAESHEFGDAGVVYEVAHADEHHDHLICVHCGKIVEFENEEIERLQVAVAEAHQFTVVDHRLEIYGACSDVSCIEAR